VSSVAIPLIDKKKTLTRDGGAMKKGINIWLTGISVLMALLCVGPVAAEVSLELLNPRGEIEPPPTLAPTPRLTDLAGKRVGLYWNGKVGTNVFFDAVEEMLKEKFPTIKVFRYVGAFDPGDALAAKMAKEVDTVIDGVGD
jgi:hypothetical protein